MNRLLELSPAARICRDSVLMFGTLVLSTLPPAAWLPWAWLPLIGLNLILLRQMVHSIAAMQRPDEVHMNLAECPRTIAARLSHHPRHRISALLSENEPRTESDHDHPSTITTAHAG